MPKRSLILAGGGVKVAYQAGVLQVWLDEAGLTFDHADGASGGVFNLAMYCQGMTGKEMADNWRRFPVLRSIGLNWFQLMRFYWSESLLTYDKFRKQVLRKRWKLDWKKINGAQRLGTFNVYNFTKNQLRVIEHKEMNEDLLVACVTLPMWFAPVTIEGDRYIDGVYLTDANLMEAIRRGADELWIIWTVSRKAQWKGGFIDSYFQIIETTANGHLQRDLDRIEASNKAIAEGKSGEFGRPIKVEMLAAEVPLHYLVNVASPEFTAAVEQGIADARAWCREKGITLAEPAKQDLMALTFSETMQGPFALGVTDPEEGRRRGLAEGTSLALHGNIRIDAFDRFVNQADHAGSLTGTVDFNVSQFGKGMAASRGVFNLFNPGGKGKEGLKHFIYEGAFEHNGKPYYLAGHKDVRDGGDLWKDTTTLYTRLHEGSDARGKVVGAGVLTLGVDDLMALLRTVEVHNASSEGERLAVLIRFFRLFLGNLWDSYARHIPGAAELKEGLAMDFDAIVIGSGFGGSVSACRLAEAGYRVLVLERGRRWDAKTYPRKDSDPWWWSNEAPERWNGWLDLRVFQHMAVAQGAAVGGGSLIYANISAVPDEFVFDRGWPPEITWEAMAPHYATVGRVMNVQPVPDNQWSKKMQLVRDGAEAIGAGSRFQKLELAVTFDREWDYSRPSAFDVRHSKRFTNAQGVEQGTCVHLGNCDIGCEVDARNTLDRNYLALAERKGADVRPLHLVTNIEPAGGGYKVSYDRLEGGRRIPGSAQARLVVLAAGSMASTEMLLRCRDVSGSLPNVSGRLGYNWSSNGDFLTPALYPTREVQPTQGPTITSAINFLDGSQGGKSFWIQDGGLPNLVANWIATARAADPRVQAFLVFLVAAMRKLGPLENAMPWFAQGIDAANGRLRLRRAWWLIGEHKLDLDWSVNESAPVIEAIVDMHKKLSEATGGIALVPPSWSLDKYLITPHPLGGCNMGTSRKNGVVDHKGEVFGYRNLFVIDGGMVPEAVGVNPSRSIAALAERAVGLIVSEGR